MHVYYTNYNNEWVFNTNDTLKLIKENYDLVFHKYSS